MKKLKQLLHDEELWKDEYLDLLEDIDRTCHLYKRYVSMPMATRLNVKSHRVKAMEGALDSSHHRHVVQIYNLSIYKQEKPKRCNQYPDAAMGRCLLVLWT